MTQKIDSAQLEKLIEENLNEFYRSRLEKLDSLKLKTVLRRKNPYLYRALNTEKASDIVEQILMAFLSSSDEAVFGDKFFEPIAKVVSGGVVSPSEGVDVSVETSDRYTAYAVKSGPNPFNSSAKKRQNDEFNSLRSRLTKLRKQFDPVLAYSYGRKISHSSDKKIYREVAGQAFWEELTGDHEFYIKLIMLMGDIPRKHIEKYKPQLVTALNRFTKEFTNDFCLDSGKIDWEKLVKFVSETPKSKKD
jgi:hypothetical protein